MTVYRILFSESREDEWVELVDAPSDDVAVRYAAAFATAEGIGAAVASVDRIVVRKINAIGVTLAQPESVAVAKVRFAADDNDSDWFDVFGVGRPVRAEAEW